MNIQLTPAAEGSRYIDRAGLDSGGSTGVADDWSIGYLLGVVYTTYSNVISSS